MHEAIWRGPLPVSRVKDQWSIDRKMFGGLGVNELDKTKNNQINKKSKKLKRL